MLKSENKIFKNLYNEYGWEIENAIKRDDWKDTKNLISKGREWIINEVKPKKQTVEPKKKSRVTKSYIYECKTYAVNQAKWKAATEFCEDRRIQFKIITEDELGLK